MVTTFTSGSLVAVGALTSLRAERYSLHNSGFVSLILNPAVEAKLR